MGFLNAIKKLFSMPSEPPRSSAPVLVNVADPKKLTYADKELLAVQRTTLDDVRSLTGFPFQWNAPIRKFITPNGHPFAYMDVIGANYSAITDELRKMNDHIENAKSLYKKLPKSLTIPISSIVYTSRNGYGYTRLICSPVDYQGKRTNTPIKLLFMTDMSKVDCVHGELCYDLNGRIQAANVHFSLRSNLYSMYYETVQGALALARIEKMGSIIYKGAHVLAREAEREREEQDLKWIQHNLPEHAPKNITGYRRMKTQNTKNYQLLKQMAADKDREI